MSSNEQSGPLESTDEKNSDKKESIPMGSLFTTMHWLHWIIIVLSLLLTVTAWQISQNQIADKASSSYERETSKIIELMLERMQRYEDTLWAAAAYINSSGGNINFEQWQNYALGIGIERKYPGINGLGVIHYVTAERLPQYLKEQKASRPDFAIHPAHDADEYLPISYIIPVEENQKAVGLDMAHEKKRYAAAKLARDTGVAQTTGPITLVQDEQQTAGFLFFVPFYGSHEIPATLDQKRDKLLGLVYAPFVVQNLVDGVLDRKLRSISFSIDDAGSEIFEEDSNSDSGYDPSPLFESTATITVYGREWTFHFRSSREFRKDLASNQPTTVLIGGITVNLLLLLLFILVSKYNSRREQHAKSLLHAQKRIEQANEELSNFNYRTSHDLVAPLKTIRGYVDLAKYDIEEKNIDGISDALDRIEKQARRLEDLVQDLLELCKIDHQDSPPEAVDPKELYEFVSATLHHLLQTKDVALEYDNQLTSPFLSEPVRIRQILENLVSNGIKYSDPAKPKRWVKITFTSVKKDWIRIEVADNGIGIPGENREKVYEMFYRAGNNTEFGSGLGNYLVKKHVSNLNGRIDYRTSPEGTDFTVDIPIKK